MGSWLLITQTSDYAFATLIIVPNKVAGVKVPLTPKSFFLLKKSTNFPFPFSEKIISIDKIFAFLQAFEHAISMFTTAQSGIWVGLRVTSLREPSSETLKRLLTELIGLSNIFGLFVIHILSKPNKTFT